MWWGGPERGLWLTVKGKVMTKWEREAEWAQAGGEQMCFWALAGKKLLSGEVKPLPGSPEQRHQECGDVSPSSPQPWLSCPPCGHRWSQGPY